MFVVDLVLIYMTGLFGWMGVPFVFGVFTRAILRLIRKGIHSTSEADIYCDDVIVFSGDTHAENDMFVSETAIEKTFGPGTSCKKKRYGPESYGEAIGWFLDFVAETVRPNDKGINNLIRCFLSLSQDEPLSLKAYQLLASLACWYSQGLKSMRPFVRPLFKMIKATKRGPKVPSIEAWTCILMWQAVIVCVIILPTKLAISLYSFALFSDFRNVELISDAGPDALGLAIYLNGLCIGFVFYILP
jgi:hypothetical protein